MLDTNVFVSAIFFPSDQTRELEKRLAGGHHIVVCDYVIEELRLVTEHKFPMKKAALDTFFRELPFELVYTPKALDLDEFPKCKRCKRLANTGNCNTGRCRCLYNRGQGFFGAGYRNA